MGRGSWWVIAVGLCACGDSGEPLVGDVSISYGGSMPALDVGAAVQDENNPGEMLVQIGSDDVNCDTYLDRFLSFDNPSGTFLYFSVDQVVGEYANAQVAAMRVTGNDTKINQTFGSVTITAVEPRVTGTVTFTTTDEDVGTISASGSFDVKRCF